MDDWMYRHQIKWIIIYLIIKGTLQYACTANRKHFNSAQQKVLPVREPSSRTHQLVGTRWLLRHLSWQTKIAIEMEIEIEIEENVEEGTSATAAANTTNTTKTTSDKKGKMEWKSATKQSSTFKALKNDVCERVVFLEVMGKDAWFFHCMVDDLSNST